MKPFFSIVIPVYNMERYLDDCLRSVSEQTYPDYEVILVDDGSTDTSGVLCDTWASLDDRIHVFHNTNHGLLATRVFGTARAEGAFIVNLDSDDMLRSDALELVHDAILRHNADLVIITASRYPDYSIPRRNSPQLPADTILTKRQIYEEMCQGSALNNMALKVFRKECAPDAEEMQEYSYVKNSEDMLQSLPVITKARRPIYLAQSIYYYRITEGGMNHAFQADYWRSVSGAAAVLRSYGHRWEEEFREAGEPINWMSRVYSRNLTTCAAAVRHYVTKGDSEDVILYLREMQGDELFRESCEKGDMRLVGRKDQLWLRLVSGRHWGILKGMIALRRIRHREE